MSSLERLSASYGQYQEVIYKERLSVITALNEAFPELVSDTVHVMENQEAAYEWLLSGARALGGRTPLEAILNGHADAVSALLWRIEHGVCS